MRLLILAGAVLLAGVANAAPPHDPDGTLVLFGGYGHLDGRAQPFFQELLAGEPDARSLFRELNIAMNTALRDELPALPKLSAYPVAVTNDDVKAALERRLGRPASDLDVDNLEKHFDHVLVLALASMLELEKGFSYPTPVGTNHWNVQVLGVAALLVSASSGDVLAMLPYIRQDKQERQLGATLKETVELYKEAGRGALRLFGERFRKRPASDLFGGWDTYMVTDYTLHDSAGKIFAGEPLADGHCREADGACQGVAALVELAASESIANAGHLVLPPVRSSEWGRSAEFRLGFTLRANQNLPIDERLALRVGADAATHRVQASLDGVLKFDKDGRSAAVVHRNFVAGFSAEVEDLGGKRASLVDPVRNSREEMLVEVLLPRSRTELSRDAEQAFSLMAILNALKEAEYVLAKR